MTGNLTIEAVENVNAKEPVRIEEPAAAHQTLNDAQTQPDAHPLAHLFGKYNDEPLWDEFLAAIEEYRRERNAQEDMD